MPESPLRGNDADRPPAIHPTTQPGASATSFTAQGAPSRSSARNTIPELPRPTIFVSVHRLSTTVPGFHAERNAEASRRILDCPERRMSYPATNVNVRTPYHD